MKVRVDEVPRTGLSLRWEEPPASLDERFEAQRAGRPGGRRSRGTAPDLLEARSPIKVEILIARSEHAVAAVGRVSAVVGLECGRCLRAIDVPLDLPVAFMFTREPARGHATPGADRAESERAASWWDVGPDATAEPFGDLDLSAFPFELPGEGLEMLEYAGAEIDLTQAVVDQVVLALPLKPLCAEACKGLCSRCGQDLNVAPCACGEEPADPRFAALKGLRLNR